MQTQHIQPWPNQRGHRRAIAFVVTVATASALGLWASFSWPKAAGYTGVAAIVTALFFNTKSVFGHELKANPNLHLWQARNLYRFLSCSRIVLFMLVFSLMGVRLLAYFVFWTPEGWVSLLEHLCILAASGLFVWHWADTAEQERARLTKAGLIS
jgi:hypothetical protein